MSQPLASGDRSPSIFGTWWPLALSWLLMGAELPVISAVVGRLPNPEVMLAAFGGVVFPIALLVESPIIMMLAASTAWSRDAASFRQLERFMLKASLALTALHALIAFTPLYDLVIIPALNPPGDVIEPARLGLQVMVLWTIAIADRRFRQGALIRFGHRETIARGTAVRLVATFLGLWVLWGSSASGIVTAAVALSVGVIVEAIFVRCRAAVLLPEPLRVADGTEQGSRASSLLAFYAPLALTPMLILAAQPIAAAGLARMPLPLEGLAVWGPLGGLVFLLRSAGIAYNEVVIAHAEDADAEARLRRFAWGWGLAGSGLLAVVAATPLARGGVAGALALAPPLAALGTDTLWLAAPIPLLTFLQSHWQGLLVHRHRTRAVTGSVVAFLVVTTASLLAGASLGLWSGLAVTLTAFTAGNAAQALWLRWRWLKEGPVRPEQPEHVYEAPEPM